MPGESNSNCSHFLENLKASFLNCLTLNLILNNAKIFSYSSTVEEASTVIGGALLKPHLTTAPPDMSPFFLRQYVKGHASDVFEAYPQLLTEMALRLPYQVQKQTDNATAIPLTFQQVIMPLGMY
jgi:E3 ubiquitin-protein ligase UBR4